MPPSVKLWSLFSKQQNHLRRSLCHSRQRHCYWHWSCHSHCKYLPWHFWIRQSFSRTPYFFAIHQEMYWWWICYVETQPRPCDRPKILATFYIHHEQLWSVVVFLQNKKGRLLTSLYTKPLIRHLSIPPNSCNFTGVFKRLVFGHIQHIFMLCSLKKGIQIKLDLLFERLLNRDYNPSFLEPCFSKAIHNAINYHGRFFKSSTLLNKVLRIDATKTQSVELSEKWELRTYSLKLLIKGQIQTPKLCWSIKTNRYWFERRNVLIMFSSTSLSILATPTPKSNKLGRKLSQA